MVSWNVPSHKERVRTCVVVLLVGADQAEGSVGRADAGKRHEPLPLGDGEDSANDRAPHLGNKHVTGRDVDVLAELE